MAQNEEKRLKRVIGRNLRRIRDERGWNDKDLTRATGLSYSTVRRWVEEERVPRLVDLHLAARRLGVTPALLLDLDVGAWTNGARSALRAMQDTIDDLQGRLEAAGEWQDVEETPESAYADETLDDTETG